MKYFAILTATICFASCIQHPNKYKALKIENLPSFNIQSLEGEHYINTADFKPGTTRIFIYFSPDCEHCHKQTKVLLKRSDILKNSFIYMIANAPLDQIRTFYSQYRLDTLQNILVGQDYKNSFYDIYLPPIVPYIAIYDKKNKLKKVYSGEYKISPVFTKNL